jgi:YVTN family beta-propeller protein
VVATLAVERDPFSLAQTPHGHTIAVANAGDNTLSLISARTLSVIATIPIRRPGQRNALTARRGLAQKLNVTTAPGGRYAWAGDQLGVGGG